MTAKAAPLAETLDRWIALNKELGVTEFRRDSEHVMYRDRGRTEALAEREGWDVHPDIYTLYEYWPDLPVMHLPGIRNLVTPSDGFDQHTDFGDWIREQYDNTVGAMSEHYRSRSEQVPPRKIYQIYRADLLVWVGIECSGPGRGAVFVMNDQEYGWSAPSLKCVYQRAMKLVEQGYCHVENGELRIDGYRAHDGISRRLVEQFGSDERLNLSPEKQRRSLSMRGAAERCLFDLDDVTAENLDEPNIVYAWRW